MRDLQTEQCGFAGVWAGSGEHREYNRGFVRGVRTARAGAAGCQGPRGAGCGGAAGVVSWLVAARGSRRGYGCAGVGVGKVYAVSLPPPIQNPHGVETPVQL